MIRSVCALTVFLALTASAPAMAQPATMGLPNAVTAADLATVQAEQQRQAVALENRLNAQDAQRRADDAVDTLRALSATPALSFAPPPPPRATPDPSSMASIPDARLAKSNARVQRAAENRR